MNATERPVTASEAYLHVFVQDYVATRNDSRNFWTLVVALVPIGVGVFAGALVLISNAASEPPARVWAFVPLFPLGATALLIQQLAMQNVRGIYERVLERLISEMLESHRTVSGDTVRAPSENVVAWRRASPPVPGFAHLIRPLFEFDLPRRRWGIPLLQHVAITVLLAVNVSLLIEAFAEASSWWWRAVMLLVYPPIALILVMALIASFDLPALWNELVKNAGDAFAGELVDVSPVRNLRNPVRLLPAIRSSLVRRYELAVRRYLERRKDEGKVRGPRC